MRGTGITRAMVQSLDAQPTIYVVHNLGLRRYVEKMIRDLHGDDVVSMVGVEVIGEPYDISRLRGRGAKIMVDHAAWEAWGRDGVMSKHDLRNLEIIVANSGGR